MQFFACFSPCARIMRLRRKQTMTFWWVNYDVLVGNYDILVGLCGVLCFFNYDVTQSFVIILYLCTQKPQIQLHMYRISIKRNNVKRVSEDPVKVISLPSKWEKWEDVSGPGEYAYELTRMLEKCEIRAYKIEDLYYLKPHKEG